MIREHRRNGTTKPAHKDILWCTQRFKEKRQAQDKVARSPRGRLAESGLLEKNGHESRGVVKDGGRHLGPLRTVISVSK